jgi:hypothetical protein
VRAVGPHEVAGAQPLLDAAVDVPHDHRHTIVVLLDGGDLGPVHHPCPCSGRPASQDGLQAGLRDEQTAARAQPVIDPDVQAGDDVRQLPAGERVHAHDRALGNELQLRLALDVLLDPDCP